MMNLKRDINRAARNLARSNVERCLQCKLFSTPKCQKPFKEEIITCSDFTQYSFKKQVVVVSLPEFAKLKSIRARESLCSF